MSDLTAMDRCDRCHAQAFVRARSGAATLLFCGHHGSAHEIALRVAGWEIDDFRHLINEKPSVSSAPKGS